MGGMEWVSDCGTVRLICGDCLEVLPTLDAGSVDAVVCDPPYGVSFSSNMRKATPSLGGVQNDGAPFVWFLYYAARILKESGSAVVFHRWDVAEDWRRAIEMAGLRVKSQLIWSKGGGGMGDLKRQFSPSHEPAWFAVKNGFQFQNGRPGTSVFSVPKVPPSLMVHPTEKPADLMSALTGFVSPSSGLVVDPFMGSGSTGVACVRLGRKFVGIEKDSRFFEISKSRISEAVVKARTPQLTLLPEQP